MSAARFHLVDSTDPRIDPANDTAPESGLE